MISLIVGIPVMILCLFFQAITVTLSLRVFTKYSGSLAFYCLKSNVLVLSVVMLVMLMGNFLQMFIWAILFIYLDEFELFKDALYFSGVTFSTLGYGDIVLTSHWKLLSPLEAANGILMFGVSTAVITTMVSDIIKKYNSKRDNTIM